MPYQPGPSLRLVMESCDALGEVSAAVLWSAWQRWIGAERFHRKLAQMSRAGWAECRGTARNLDRVIRLTAAGRLAAVGGRDADARWSRPWDGRWRLVLFDIPEHTRGLRLKLRRRLHDLGFGYLQDSVWISPDPARELQERVQSAQVDAASFMVMEARPDANSRDSDLVRAAWNFDRINRNYVLYLETLNAGPRCWENARARHAWFRAEFRAWQRAFNSDPLLPDSLLPVGYRGKDAWSRRHERLRHMLR